MKNLQSLRKPVTLLLLAAMLSGVCLSGCGDNAQSGGETTTSGETTTKNQTDAKTRLDELGERDFGGAVFTVLDATDGVNINHPDETLEGDTVNDTVAKRDRLIAEKYNLQFEYPKVDDRIAAVRNSVLAGDQICDVMFAPIPDAIGSLAIEGMLADLCKMESLSLDENWWSPLVYENCRIGGKMYYTTGDISPISYRAPACYYANETLLDQYKISKDEIYAAVENGTWTLDMLHTLAGELDRDLNDDGAFYADDDFFGILNENNNLTAACFMTAAGINLSSIDKNGNLYADLNNEKAINAVEKLTKVLSKAPRKDQNALHNAFKNDRVVFLMHYASSGYTRYRDMNSNYIMLPLPKYDENQKTYRSLVNTWANAFLCVPTNADTERAGFVMEAMAYMSLDILRPAAYDMAMKVKGVRNDKDSAILDTIMDSIYLDFNSFMEFGGSISPMSNAIFNGGSYTSSIAAVIEGMNAEMEKFSGEWTK